MPRVFPGLAFLAALLLPFPASAQSAAAYSTDSSPVALVYVTSMVRSSFQSYYYQIYGFTAAADGALTPIPGLPLNTSAGDIVANHKYLFGTDGTYIYSYAIASDGTLNLVSTINAEALSGCVHGVAG